MLLGTGLGVLFGCSSLGPYPMGRPKSGKLEQLVPGDSAGAAVRPTKVIPTTYLSDLEYFPLAHQNGRRIAEQKLSIPASAQDSYP